MNYSRPDEHIKTHHRTYRQKSFNAGRTVYKESVPFNLQVFNKKEEFYSYPHTKQCHRRLYKKTVFLNRPFFVLYYILLCLHNRSKMSDLTPKKLQFL